jgi:hypothetical protein
MTVAIDGGSNQLRAPATVSRESEPLVVTGQTAKRAGALLYLVGTAEITRVQDANCALRSEVPELFTRCIVSIRPVTFPFPDQQCLLVCDPSDCPPSLQAVSAIVVTTAFSIHHAPDTSLWIRGN